MEREVWDVSAWCGYAKEKVCKKNVQRYQSRMTIVNKNGGWAVVISQEGGLFIKAKERRPDWLWDSRAAGICWVKHDHQRWAWTGVCCLHSTRRHMNSDVFRMIFLQTSSDLSYIFKCIICLAYLLSTTICRKHKHRVVNNQSVKRTSWKGHQGHHRWVTAWYCSSWRCESMSHRLWSLKDFKRHKDSKDV